MCDVELKSGLLVSICAWGPVMILWVWFVSREACTNGFALLRIDWGCLTLGCNVVDLVAYLVVTTNGSQCVTVIGTHPVGSAECVVVG